MRNVIGSLVLLISLQGCNTEAMKDEKLIAEGQASAAAGLRDPASALFTEVTARSSSQVCGLVNGKNAYGGYAGPKRFVYQSGSKATIEPDLNPRMIGAAAGTQLCMFDISYGDCKGNADVPSIDTCYAWLDKPD